MSPVRFPMRMLVVAATLAQQECALGQAVMGRPVRVITTESGSANDLLARLIAPLLTGSLGQQVVVDNRGNASGIVAAQIVATAKPDGHTLLFYGSGLWLLPFMKERVPYDAVRDYAPITLAGSSPNILVVHPAVPASSVKDLITYARTRPGELNYGSGSTGTTPHLAAELFNAMAGVHTVIVPYKGGGSALNALVGGEVQLMFPTVGLGMPQVKSGRLRALAVTSDKPSALAPGMPTVAASGLPGYESVLMSGVYAPAGTPSNVVSRLHQEITRIMSRPDIRERFLAAGLDPIGSTPEQLAASVKADMARWGKVIRDAGIRVD